LETPAAAPFVGPPAPEDVSSEHEAMDTDEPAPLSGEGKRLANPRPAEDAQ
jgi:hypothetical protein